MPLELLQVYLRRHSPGRGCGESFTQTSIDPGMPLKRLWSSAARMPPKLNGAPGSGTRNDTGLVCPASLKNTSSSTEYCESDPVVFTATSEGRHKLRSTVRREPGLSYWMHTPIFLGLLALSTAVAPFAEGWSGHSVMPTTRGRLSFLSSFSPTTSWPSFALKSNLSLVGGDSGGLRTLRLCIVPVRCLSRPVFVCRVMCLASPCVPWRPVMRTMYSPFSRTNLVATFLGGRSVVERSCPSRSTNVMASRYGPTKERINFTELSTLLSLRPTPSRSPPSSRARSKASRDPCSAFRSRRRWASRCATIDTTVGSASRRSCERASALASHGSCTRFRFESDPFCFSSNSLTTLSSVLLPLAALAVRFAVVPWTERHSPASWSSSRTNLRRQPFRSAGR
mmetsp:Transcript_3390/g.6693  ORF Transcript_3390/g.6693 Transcript_3390/m.6693 type:complete len:396 (+) Transcript_3390:9114-10301(+)